MNKVYVSAKKKWNHYFMDMDKVRKSDWFILGGLLFVCCYFFCQKFDLKITIKHSITMIESLLGGRPQHFYGDVYEKAISGYYGTADPANSANYTYLFYAVLALVNFPLYVVEKLFQISFSIDVYVAWVKTFIVVVTFATGYVMKKIGLQLKMSNQRSNWLAFAFISSPIVLLGSTSFGQMDIFCIFFLCLAMLKYFNKEYYKFCFYMALAIELKLFAMLAFVVLVLLIEKKLWNIVKYLLTGFSLYLIETIIFSFSGGKKLTSQAMTLYGFKNRIFSSGIEAFQFISFIIVGFVIVVVLAYMIKIKTDEEHVAYGILFPLAMYVILFGFIKWHPQWLCIMVPFITLALFLFPNYKLSMYIEIALGASFIIVTTLWFQNNVDVGMINHGTLAALTKFTATIPDITIHNKIFMQIPGLPMSLYSSIFFGALMMFLLTKLPFLNKKPIFVNDANEPISRSFIWTRMFTILLYIVPTVAFYIYQWAKA